VKILVSWLREYVDVPVSIEQLAKDLTMRGFEVASIELVDGDPDDAVIDFEITANRPDCLSVIGMAREVAVKYGVPLRSPVPAPAVGSRPSTVDDPVPGARNTVPGDLRVTVERPDLCPTYCAALMDVIVTDSAPELRASVEPVVSDTASRARSERSATARNACRSPATAKAHPMSRRERARIRCAAQARVCESSGSDSATSVRPSHRSATQPRCDASTKLTRSKSGAQPCS